MESRILPAVKDYLGIQEDTTAFDGTLKIIINMALMTLNDLGVGPKNPVQITDSYDEWSLLGLDDELDRVKTYIYLRTMLTFDPPQTHVVMDALKDTLHELEWRLRTRVEDYKE